MNVSWDFISSSSTKVWACSLVCLASVWHLCWSYQLSETFNVNIKFNNLMAHYASSEKSTSTGTKAGVLKQAVQWVCVQRDAQHCQCDFAEIEKQHIKSHNNGSVHCFHNLTTWNSNSLIMWSLVSSNNLNRDIWQKAPKVHMQLETWPHCCAPEAQTG